MEKLFLLGIVGAILALGFALIQRNKVMSFSEGTERMQKLAESIRQGANAYLKQQYSTVLKVFVAVFAILLVMAFATGGEMLSKFTPFAFVTGGLFSMLAGFIGMIRVCMASQSIPKAMVNKEFTIIPAVILGGASIFGGEGSVFGTVSSIALITLVSNSMLLLGIDTYWQQFFNGLVILVGVTVSALQAKRQKQ